MTLTAGIKLGPYEILARIGAGGMGEVYRARDPRVGRDVAVKVSSEQFTDRFTREIHAVAALNHSNVCTLYDVGPNYLVMELIEGPTLADCIKQGPIPLEESLEIARQIADALEAAHEKGIVHRDLKPGNIKVRPDGTVKVLDFGLAKVEETVAVSLETSPTLSVAQTAAGVLLGTAAYMSPEQARGKAVDKRADIWAFGVVLYEMLTGRQLFTGETVSDTLAAVLKEEPDLEKVPAKARPLLRRCLEKDPKKRLRDIGEAMAWIECAPESVPVKRSWLAWGWAAIATLLVIAFAVYSFLPFRSREAPQEMLFHISVPSMPNNYGIAISPDGRLIAFIASPSRSIPSLFIREIGSATPKKLEGTEGASCLFWSPDSRSIGFLAGGRLKISEVSGGSPREICAAGTQIWGAAWNSDGIILFSLGAVLRRVSAAGGDPIAITTVEGSEHSPGCVYPSFLPDGRHYVYTQMGSTLSKNGVYVGSLDSKEKTRLIVGNVWRAVCAESGYLLFERENTLFAQSFNLKKLALTGEAVRIADNVRQDWFGRTSWSVSQNGRLIYRSGGVQDKSQFMWFDRTGKLLRTVGEAGIYGENFDLSPDGRRIALTRNNDVWLMELEREVMTQLTFDSADKSNVVWSPDDLRIAFNSSQKGNVDIFLKQVSGFAEETPLVESSDPKFPTAWSKDGRYIAYTSISPANESRLYALPLSGDRKPFQIFQSPPDQDESHFSYDGKWLAYNSDESGIWQVYVVSFPAADQKRQISTNGGAQARWRIDGTELYYLALDGKMMAVDIKGDITVEPSVPHTLFDSELEVDPVNEQYAVTPDGQRFLLRKPLAEATATPITVVLNWTSLLKK